MIELDFSKGQDGLVPAIAQDYQTGEILMLAFVNREAWEHTLRSGHATYWSRSRSKLWVKGESSGNVQKIRDVYVDCDMDAVVYKVEQVGGAACHTGHRTCFYRRVDGDSLTADAPRVFDPDTVYGSS